MYNLIPAQYFEVMSEENNSGGSAWSWLWWILLLAFINLLSWIFDWSFWVY